jgi:hypothetical protein
VLLIAGAPTGAALAGVGFALVGDALTRAPAIAAQHRQTSRMIMQDHRSNPDRRSEPLIPGGWLGS